MGMYTELVCALELKRDTPNNVIEILKYMLNDEEEINIELPKHELFGEDTRWRFMLQCDSYYFDGTTHSFLKEDSLYGIENPMYYLNVRCNLKNYSNEIDLFIDWIKQYSETIGFIGYKRYEEDEHPTLIYI